MIRLLRIARREYLAYVKTFGFWLSMATVPFSIFVFGALPTLMAKNTPPPIVTIVDLTGQGYGAAAEKAFLKPDAEGGRKGGAISGIVRPSPVPAAGDSAALGAALKPWLLGEKTLPGGGRLGVAAVIHAAPGAQPGDKVTVDFWSSNLSQLSARRTINQAVDDHFQQLKLKAAGLSESAIAALDQGAPDVADFSPKAAEGKASFRDRLPGIVGFAMAMLLWMLIFTGAGLLLNSVIEEKSSRILEVLLSSASVPEIMFGKILGVAAVAVTVLAVWASLAGVGLAVTNPRMAGDIAAVVLGKGLIFYFAVYLVGGYLMYASIFTAVGAFCETTREAQTLLGPIMMLLAVPIVFMTQAITNPEAPILEALSWVPLFTPFLMTARAAVEPPLWEVLGTGALMLATVALVVWIAGRAFRAGALSTGKVDFKGLVMKLRRAD